MKVLVLNGSPKGKNSITLQTVIYLQQHFKKTEFDILHVGQRIKSIEKDFSEAEEKLRSADLILFAYPVYTFLVPAQLCRFIELIKAHGVDLKDKYATQLTTSKHFYDTTAHRFIEDNCDDLGMRYIRGLSADMEDLLSKKGQKEALAFFRYVRWNMKEGLYEPRRYPSGGSGRKPSETAFEGSFKETADKRGDRRIVIVADYPEDEEKAALKLMIDYFRAVCPCTCDVVNLRTFPFAGGCLGCFHCASDGSCIYKDGFDRFLREHIQTADAIVYAYTIKDHAMGSRFKMFDDRQFCNGHRTLTMGRPIGYLVDGDLQGEDNLCTLMEARSQVGGNYPAGIACLGASFEQEARQLAKRLVYCMDRDYRQPKNFYGVGGLKIFRDLIYQMQGLMKEDHRFYKANGFYDFPQKRKGTIAAMYLVGAMMSSPRLSKKMSGKMTEGMLMPYRKVTGKGISSGGGQPGPQLYGEQ